MALAEARLGRIAVTFDPHTSGALNTLAVMEVFDENSMRLAGPNSGAWIVPVPVGSIELPVPGIYALRVALPSGESQTKTVRLTMEEPDASVTFQSTQRSPRETLAWAYARQSVRAQSALMSAMPLLEFASVPDVRVDIVGHFEPEQKQDVKWRLRKSGTKWKALGIADDARLSEHIEISASRDPRYLCYDGIANDVRQRWIVALPPATRPLEVLFVRATENETTPAVVRPLVKGLNAQAESLLSYLMRGSVAQARVVDSYAHISAIDLLSDKFSDEAAACVGAYYLLAVSDFSREDWLKNLAGLRLPDGLIAYGTCLLRLGRVMEAIEWFGKAVRCGIPCFTIGLRSLFDGIREIHKLHPAEPAIEPILQRVRAAAAFADWDAMYSTIQISEKAPALSLEP